MSRLRRPHLALVMLCVALLLLTQGLGLHHHRHVEFGGAVPAHAAELHFEDSGLHGADRDHGHGHGHGHDHGPAPDVAAAHPHLDIDIKPVAKTPAKVFLDLLIFGLPTLVVLFLLPPATLRRPPAVVRCGPRRSAYRLRPPSQAPPYSLVPA